MRQIDTRQLFLFIIILIGTVLLITYNLNRNLKARYNEQISPIIRDRHGNEIAIMQNIKGHYMRQSASVPEEFSKLLIQKEDKFFNYHPGINPASIARSLTQYIFRNRLNGSSTITQQLTKNLLGNENHRTIRNKIIEAIYAFSLELYTPKAEILTMYAETAYFGNQAEGIREAAQKYFGADPETLSTQHILELIATLNHPSDPPGDQSNKKRVSALKKRFGIEETGNQPEEDNNTVAYKRKDINAFELEELRTCATTCTLSIDNTLTHTLREVLQKNLASPAFESVKNGAIVVIRIDKTKDENELLAIVGSPSPFTPESGYQINMATKPRPIGSTWKPFIYAKAFERGARPYTTIEDLEYKYDIGTGYAFYPKNYDGKYRGDVTIHYALANSLNVPAVRALQFVGLTNFAQFLTDRLSFRPRQPLEQYQLSIALGGLEMDILTLVNYFSIFPNNGVFKPLTIGEGYLAQLPMSSQPPAPEKIIEPAFTELVTKILSDRTTGVDQFGLKSNLNLPALNYAVKTGTSYDYHDSWAIGYTPDFVVGVWIGNSDNKPMQQISGSIGAGKIWHDAMSVLLNSEYNTETIFDMSHIKEYQNGSMLEYGLSDDNYEITRDLLKNTSLILQPHHNDILEYEKNMTVPLIARESAEWGVNGEIIGQGANFSWRPLATGRYILSARDTLGKIQKLQVIIQAREY